MKPLYVRTNDFRLAHRLLSEFKQRDLPAKQVAINDPIDTEAYWFGTADEVRKHGGRGVAVDPEEVAETVSTWLLSRQLTEPPSRLIVGVDPGPRPGCAFFADGMLLGKRELESIEEALDHIVNLVEHTRPSSVLVRIGHGSPVHRDRLLNHVISLGYHVEIVDEHRTSTGQPRHAHGSAALKIAMLQGAPVHEQRTVSATPGELRNLQRISRRRSKGQLTISLSTALLVSQGKLTMDEALKQSGYDAS